MRDAEEGKRGQAHPAVQQYAEWFLRERHRLLRYACGQLHGGEDAEQVLSNVLQKVGRALVSGRVLLTAEEMEAYTLRSISNEATSRMRSAERRRKTESLYVCSGADGSEDNEEEAAAVRWAILQLPAEFARLITLHLWEDMSFAAMAELLHVPAGTLRDRYNKALVQLEQVLKDNDLP